MQPFLAASICTAGAMACAVLGMLKRGKQRVPSAERLRHIIMQAMQQIANKKDWQPGHQACVILSGGLDSGIVAEVGRDILGLTHAITVIASDGATDLPWSTGSAKAAGLQHHVVHTSVAELVAVELPHVVKELQSFDPMSLRNEIAVSCALRKAAELGCTCAVTGDGADELFGGYGFTHGLEADRWKYSQQRMAQLMQFGSVPLGASLGVFVTSPFVQPQVVRTALRFSKADCVDALAGPGGTPLGKMPLRLAFPGVSSAMRGKDPIEHFDSMITDEDLAAESAIALEADGVVIRDKEHLCYYRVFRSVFPGGHVPGKARDGPYACPKCRYPLSHPTQTFCHTCGHYDPSLPEALKMRGVNRAPRSLSDALGCS